MPSTVTSGSLRPVANRDPRLGRTVVGIAWPASAEFLIITGVVFSDILFLSRLGSEVIAGVGIAITVFRSFYEIFNAVAVASTTVVAQAVGARNADLARRGAGQSLTLAVVLGLLSGGIGFAVARSAMVLMGTTGAVRDAGALYMQLNLLASPFYAVALTGGGVLKGVGDTRTPMAFTLASSVLKIGLSWVLVFGKLGMPALGVAGAALATIFAYVLNAALISTKLLRGFDGIKIDSAAFKPDWSLLRRVLALALPIAGERVVMRMGFVFYMRMVSALGTVALAANQIALRLESISITVGFGFTVAATTLVGQAVGGRDIRGAEERAWATVRFSLMVMGTMTAVLVLARSWAVGIFVPEPEVESLALACIVIGAFELPALGLMFTFAGALRGAGDTRSPMAVSLIGTFLFRLPLVYLLGITFGLGLKGIWYGTLVDWIGRAVLIYLIFRAGRWKGRAFVEDDEVSGGPGRSAGGSGEGGSDEEGRGNGEEREVQPGVS
jgi:putative MATE family efflux protein